MEEFLAQAQAEAVDLAAAWEKGNVSQRQELAKAFFLEGLVFGPKRGFFEPTNTVLYEMVWSFVANLGNGGVPDGI